MTGNDQHEKDVLSRYVAGDRSAFEAIYNQYVGLVYSVCLRCLKNPQDAEDATSACFVVFLKKAGTIAGDSRLATWLYSCALRTARNAARLRQRRAERETRAHDMDLMEKEGGDRDWGEVLPHVERQIGELPTAQRQAMILHFYEGLSIAEMAERLGCPEGSIRSRMHSGMKTLRKKLARFGQDMSEELITSGMTGAALLVPVPYSLTLKLAAMAKGEAIAGAVMEIARATMRSLAWAQAKVTAVIVGATLIAGGAGGLAVTLGVFRAENESVTEQPVAQVPIATVAPAGEVKWVDGPVIFEDDFENGLENWRVVRMPSKAGDSLPSRKFHPVDDAPDEPAARGFTLRLDSCAGMRGTQTKCALLNASDTGKTIWKGIELRKPVPAGPFAVEYDFCPVLGEEIGVEGFSLSMNAYSGEDILFRTRSHDRGLWIPKDGVWCRVRKEYIPLRATDKPGLELSYRINGQEMFRERLFCVPESFVLAIRNGSARFDNVVVRQMVPVPGLESRGASRE